MTTMTTMTHLDGDVSPERVRGGGRLRHHVDAHAADVNRLDPEVGAGT